MPSEREIEIDGEMRESMRKLREGPEANNYR
jgi:hypothetical protein